MKVVIAYKKTKTQSDPNLKNPYNAGGLACNALHSVGVLREMGVKADLLQVDDFNDLEGYLSSAVSSDVTNLIIEAVWLTVPQIPYLAVTYPEIDFVIRAHSKMGFLQVEPEAITTMRQIIGLSQIYDNINFSSNNEEFSKSLAEVFGPCLYLPNLYDIAGAPKLDRSNRHGKINIASFGASRLLKLHPNAALAALQIGAKLGKHVNFFINADRTPGGDSVRKTIRNLFDGLKHATLTEVGWQDAETFKKTIASMDLVLQLSATETFCMVAADAVASGVPVVGSYALNWLPDAYQVNADDTGAVARLGAETLGNSRIARDERKSLEHYLKDAKRVWRSYLGLERTKRFLFF